MAIQPPSDILLDVAGAADPAKVREATSNDPWGPSGTQMNEIAQMTYNQ